MTGRLQGKIAVVTGAGRNIGRAEALLLAAEGASLIVNDYGGGSYGTEKGTATPADDVVAEIVAAGGTAVADYSNVATREGAEAAINAAIDNWGRIDILINNAGIVRPARIDRMTDEDWELCLGVSLNASFYTCRRAARHMIEQKSGAIVNTGSPSGFGHLHMANYSAAKEGLVGFTRSIARSISANSASVPTSFARFRISPVRSPRRSAIPSRKGARLGIPLLWNKPMAKPRMTALPDHVAAACGLAVHRQCLAYQRPRFLYSGR